MKKYLILPIITFLISGCVSSPGRHLAHQKTDHQEEKASTYNLMGNNLVKNNLLTEATEKYMLAVKTKPDFAVAHYSLGRVLLKRGFHEKGIKSIKTAISHNVNYTEAQNFLSNYFYKQGLYEEALKHSINASKNIIYANQEETLTQLGLVYDKLGKKKQSLLNMKRALASKPITCSKRFEIAKFFYKKGFVKTALKVTRQADKICTSDDDANSVAFLKALIFYKSENYVTSLKLLNSISPKQNRLKKAIPKLMTKINSKTGL